MRYLFLALLLSACSTPTQWCIGSCQLNTKPTKEIHHEESTRNPVPVPTVSPSSGS